MLIETNDTKVPLQAPQAETRDLPPLPPPPPYSPIDDSNFIPISIKPTNYVFIKCRNESTKGTYAIDPSLQIPADLLPPPFPGETGESRANLRVQTENGSAVAEIYLVSPKLDWNAERKRAMLYTRSQNGSTRIKLHRLALGPSFYMESLCINGSITIHIPRSFRGLITAKTVHGSSRFSNGVASQARTLSNVDGAHRVFIGDYNADDTLVDEVVLETRNESIQVLYDDERESSHFSNVSSSVTNVVNNLLGWLTR